MRDHGQQRVPCFACGAWGVRGSDDACGGCCVREGRPRFPSKITEDSEYGLFNVTLFKRVAADFKAAARERKYGALTAWRELARSAIARTDPPFARVWGHDFVLRAACRFVVRDFDFNEKQIDAERQERSELNEKLKKQLVRSGAESGNRCRVTCMRGVFPSPVTARWPD